MKTLALSLGLLSLSLGGCAGRQADVTAPRVAERPIVFGDGVPDPAEAKCSALGGDALGVARGQVRLCRVDQAVIDDWTLFWATTSHDVGAAGKAFLAHRPIGAMIAGDPAASYCAAVGGTPLSLRDASGKAGGICKFDDDSIIDLQTLLRGPGEQGNLRLAALLR
jgi:putative hemolysin